MAFEFKIDKDAPLFPTEDTYKNVMQIAEENFMKMVKAHDDALYTKGYGDGYGAAKDEIVRCKDCKEYGENPYGEKGDMFCKCWGDWIPTEPDDFCSRGERKDCGKINARMPEAAGRTSEREDRTNGENERAGNS